MDIRMTAGQQERFIAKLADWVRDEMLSHLEYKAEQDAHCFESPIELAFWLAWLVHGRIDRIVGERFDQIEPIKQHEIRAGGNHYRLDFAFVDEPRGIKVAVELDGHDFHERTPEQVEHRNHRDADLQSAEWVVLHFSGRQILQKPDECAARVHDAICDSVERAAYVSWRRAGG